MVVRFQERLLGKFMVKGATSATGKSTKGVSILGCCFCQTKIGLAPVVGNQLPS